MIVKKCPRRNKHFRLGLDPMESHLRWAVNSLPSEPAGAQAVIADNAHMAGASRACASVSVRAVGAGTPRGGGTSGIARIPSACGR